MLHQARRSSLLLRTFATRLLNDCGKKLDARLSLGRFAKTGISTPLEELVKAPRSCNAPLVAARATSIPCSASRHLELNTAPKRHGNF